MREYQIGHSLEGKIQIPDELAFAYNPNFVTISGVTTVDVVYLVFTEASEYGHGEETARAKVYLLNGYAHVDISAYLRSEFAGKVKGTDAFKTWARITIHAEDASSSWVVDDAPPFTVIYGAILPGEIFNPSRTVKLWSAYPQVVSFFHPNQKDGDCTVYLQKDLEEPSIYQLPQGDYEDACISNYDNQAEALPMQESGQIVVYPSKETTLATFSMQYDGTFTGVDDATIINIEIDNTPQCDDHIFLRWLDKHGMWQHWLFRIGEVKMTDAVVGSAMVFLAGTTYPYYATRNIGKSLVKQVTACAPNVTREQWEMLTGIKGSVNVCAFNRASQSWVAVNVTAEGSTWKRGAQEAYLQNFSVKVAYPTIQTQRL